MGDAIAKQRTELRRNERQIFDRAEDEQWEVQEVSGSTKALTARSLQHARAASKERASLFIIVKSAGLMQTLAWRTRLAASGP